MLFVVFMIFMKKGQTHILSSEQEDSVYVETE